MTEKIILLICIITLYALAIVLFASNVLYL